VEKQRKTQDHNPHEMPNTATEYLWGGDSHRPPQKLKLQVVRNSMGCFKCNTIYRKYVIVNASVSRMYLVSISNTVLSGIKDDKFM
jgi:hypothetical protein